MKTKRLFIAIQLPAAMKDALAVYLEPYKELACLKKSRWVATVNLHITALFLGDVSEEDIPLIDKLLQVELTNIEPFELIFEKIAFAPSERHPHMIWAKFEKSQKFVDLAGRLQLSLGCFDEKQHEPLAHVTLARLHNFYTQEKPHFHELVLPSLPVETCALMESELTNEGPIYSVLGNYFLGKNRS